MFSIYRTYYKDLVVCMIIIEKAKTIAQYKRIVTTHIQ